MIRLQCAVLVLLGAFSWSVFSSAVLAHEAIHTQIAAVTARIAQEPQNAALYVRRGDLYRYHQLWDQALADYERAAKADPSFIAVDLARGKLWFEAGRRKLHWTAFWLNTRITSRPV